MRWRVVSFEEMGNVLSDDNDYTEDLTTSGRFVRVTIETENLTNEPHYIDAPVVLDDRDRTFEYNSDFLVITIIPDDELCSLEEINPNIVRTCTWYYELPADASGLSLQLSDYTAFLGGEDISVPLQ